MDRLVVKRGRYKIFIFWVNYLSELLFIVFCGRFEGEGLDRFCCNRYKRFSIRGVGAGVCGRVSGLCIVKIVRVGGERFRKGFKGFIVVRS